MEARRARGSERAKNMKIYPTDQTVSVKWFVWAGNEKVPFESSMRGTWGFDAKCSCGWESRTGGGTRTWLKELVRKHKLQNHNYSYMAAA
jgi:N6-adenosine-specific RNA methylase IME4